MSEVCSVNLRRVVPEDNMFRRYSVTVGRDLFGQPLVTYSWGRIGTRGQTRQQGCATIEEAQAVAAKCIEERLRRGYSAVTAAPAPQAVAPTSVTAPPRAARPQRRRQLAAAQLSLLEWIERRRAAAKPAQLRPSGEAPRRPAPVAQLLRLAMPAARSWPGLIQGNPCHAVSAAWRRNPSPPALCGARGPSPTRRHT